MKEKLAINLIFILILVTAAVGISGCIGDEDTITWREFITDFIDTDDDGERDDFSSYEVGDKVIIKDTISDISKDRFTNEITFESYTEEAMMFYGSAIDIHIGDQIEVTIKIVSGTGEGGGVIEDYSAEEIQYND